jgi:hypothetical protein
MDQWDYTTCPFPGHKRSKKHDDRLAELNRLGKEGWEVASTVTLQRATGLPAAVMLLKRRLA